MRCSHFNGALLCHKTVGYAVYIGINSLPILYHQAVHKIQQRIHQIADFQSPRVSHALTAGSNTDYVWWSGVSPEFRRIYRDAGYMIANNYGRYNTGSFRQAVAYHPDNSCFVFSIRRMKCK